MNKLAIGLATVATLAMGPLAAYALGTAEKGCLVGGAAGGLIGHAVDGKRTLLGAAVGCGAGVLVNKQRVKKIDAKERERKLAESRRHKEARYTPQTQYR